MKKASAIDGVEDDLAAVRNSDDGESEGGNDIEGGNEGDMGGDSVEDGEAEKKSIDIPDDMEALAEVSETSAKECHCQIRLFKLSLFLNTP